MAYSRVTYIGDGSNTIFTVPFEYLKKSFVKVVVAEEPVPSENFEWLTSTSIKLAVAPAAGSTIYIYRDTEKEAPVTGYRDGSVLTGSDLDNQTRQLLHIAQETQDVADEQMRLDSHDRKYDAQSRVIKNVADPVDDTDAMTYRAWKQDILPSIDASLAQATTKAAQAEASAVNANSSALLASGQATISGQHAREAEASASASAQSAVEAKVAAEEAKATLPENWMGRVEALEDSNSEVSGRVAATETKNTQQDDRLTSVESDIKALTTMLIGSIQAVLCGDSYVPNGCVPANGGEYTRDQFPSLYDTYLAPGKLLTCTYAAWAAQVALTGNCAKFALDTTAKKFKVPLLKDGDSITQATSAAELGKSVKAGVPNITGEFAFRGGANTIDSGSSELSGAFTTGATRTAIIPAWTSGSVAGGRLKIDASLSSPIYGNSTTVTDEQVRLRHFVVVASAQNSASVFDWSNYMVALTTKANTDLTNATGNAFNYYLHVYDEKPSGTTGGATTGGAWQTRDLNTVKVNRINGSLANNRITLPGGRYYIRASVPVFAGNAARAALFNYTTSTYLLYSPSYYADYAYNGHPLMVVEGEFLLADTSTIELRMWVQSSYTYGLGRAVGISGVTEKYTEAIIWKM